MAHSLAEEESLPDRNSAALSEEKINHINRVVVFPSTRKDYLSYQKKFLTWIGGNLPETLNGQCEIDVAKLKVRMLQSYIVQLKKGDGSTPGISTMDKIRSSWFNLFRDSKVTVTEEEGNEISVFFKGLRRLDAQMRASGEQAVVEGKSPISFGLSKWIAMAFIRKSNTFAHLYLVLICKLMCRANNTASIRLNHLNWVQDCFGVFFAKTKCDQEGDHPKDPKHVYGNPCSPEICPLLSIGTYFLCIQEVWNTLFPGGSQNTRFSCMLTDVLRTSVGKQTCQSFGYRSDDFGVHSLRKGSSIYVSSGSTCGPCIVSLCLPCGWSMGGVQDRYLRYEATGDQYCGTIVSGVQLDSSQFAVLPPHFLDPLTLQFHLLFSLN